MLRSLVYFVVSRWLFGWRTADNDDLSRDVELLILHRLCVFARGRRSSLRRTDRLLQAAAMSSRPEDPPGRDRWRSEYQACISCETPCPRHPGCVASPEWPSC